MPKYIIFFALILLLALSGCIQLLNTQEKQACLAATHLSTTSIPSCDSQEGCLNKINEITISKNITKEINNDIIIYQNKLASSYYYFNQSKNLLKKLNKACSSANPKDMITIVNDLFFNFGQIFTYVDSSSESSIIHFRDMVVYLESQGIDLIPEEELYTDYILLNENINELKEQTSNNNYINNLIKEVAIINEISKDFGFKKTYLSEISYIDLTTYYLKLINEPSESTKVPTIAPGFYYVLDQLSSIAAFRKVNLNLKNTDNYNLYLVLDRIVGQNNSTSTEFIKINNQINNNLDVIYEKIKILENKIIENKEYLENSDYIEFMIQRKTFAYSKITFGEYLKNLKNYDIAISRNKLLNEELIIEENIVNNCIEELTKIINLNIIELEDFVFINPGSQEECTYIINIINERLNNNSKIKLLNNIVSENKILINELLVHSNSYNFDNKLILLNYYEIVQNIEKNQNYENIININEIIDTQTEINTNLKEMCKQIITNPNNGYIEIIYDVSYYLSIDNPFSINLEEIIITDGINFDNFEFLEKNYKTNNKIIIPIIYSGKNYYLIAYINNREINTEIIKLDLSNSILETIVENEVIGIQDSVYIGNGVVLLSGNGLVYDGILYFETEKINEFIYYKDILNKIVMSQSIEEIINGTYVIKEEFTLKNEHIDDIDNKLCFENINFDDIIIIKENDVVKETFYDGNKLCFTLNLELEQTKSYNMQTLTNKINIYNKIYENIYQLINLKNSRFLDISTAASEISEDIELIIKENYTITEIIKIYNKTEDIEELIEKENLNKIIEDNFILLYTELLENPLINTEELNQIKAINDSKYTNINNSYLELQNIQQNIINRITFENSNTKKESLNKLQTIYEIITKYGIEDELLNELIGSIVPNLNNNKIFEDIEQKLNKNLKTKAKELNKQLDNFNLELNIKEINAIIEEVYWIFEDFTLQELFSINYYPEITPNDAERLSKKQDFLDTIMYSDEVHDFQENYNLKDYISAIDAISQSTIDRLNEIYIEKKLLEDGINKIKEDAKEELDKYIKDYKENEEIIELAKQQYSEGKYLNTIVTIRSNSLNLKQNNNNYQILIVAFILMILALLFVYFRINNNKSNNKTVKDKKKKVIRHH